jgi:uncharacterized lipoprotein YajG
MNAGLRLAPLVLTLVALGGCAFTPQQTQIKADIEVARSDIGQGRPVYVLVTDERPTTEIGRRGTGAMEGAAITTSQDVAAVFRDALQRGITSKGFVPVGDAAGSARELRVDVRLLEYDTSMGFWTGGVHTRSALKASVLEGNAVLYENLYRDEAEERVVFVPGAAENDVQINKVVNGVLAKLFADEALLVALARAAP